MEVYACFSMIYLPELNARQAHQIMKSPTSEPWAFPMVIRSRWRFKAIRGPTM